MSSVMKRMKSLVQLPPFVFGMPYAVGIGLHFIPFMPRLPLPTAVSLTVGVALIACSVALIGWARNTFRNKGENPSPRSPTKTLVTVYPYKFTRNPFYVSFVLLAIGVALILKSVSALAAVPVAMGMLQYFVIYREERYLKALFGEAYESYMRHVRRWI